jgi:transcriptional regulator with XRE-family HTH domain
MQRVPPPRQKEPTQALPPLRRSARRLRWSGPVQEEALTLALLRIMNHVQQRRRLSLHAVERLTGIQRDRLRRMERLQIKRLSLRTLTQWCNGLRIDLDALIDLAKEVIQAAASRCQQAPRQSRGLAQAPARRRRS